MRRSRVTYVPISALMGVVALAFDETAWAQLSSFSSGCVAPGTCVAPAAEHSSVLPIKPRQQWNINGGFCGAMSVQVAAMGFGAWISQDLVRKANTHGAGHGDPRNGYEVLPTNVGETARSLRLFYEEWDYTQPKPQIRGFKKWMKSHLVKSHPVVMFPMCKGDPHLPYPGSGPNGGHFDHVEPIIGIGSNRSLDDPTVYDDDWILHFSDQDLNPYYRKFSTLEDGTDMSGNCKHAGAGFGRNEMYPCVFDEVDYGLAVTGLNVSVPTLRASLDVDHQSEPDVRRFWQKPVQLRGTVTVIGLQKGSNYVLYRYSGTSSLPASDLDVGYENKVAFTAAGEVWTYQDPSTFLSSGATYYVAVPAPQGDSAIVV